MTRRALQFERTWRLRSNAEQLWPLVADTNRFDRDAGTPAIRRSDEGDDLGRGRVRVRFARLGIPLEYVQEPFEWDAPRRFAVHRRFTKGPIAEMRVELTLEPRPDGDGTDLRYRVDAKPRLAVLAPLVRAQIASLLDGGFERTFRRYDDLAGAGTSFMASGARPALAAGAPERLGAAGARMRADGVSGGIVDQLLDLLRRGDDLTVSRLRPYALADRWGRERRAVLDAFLVATRAGLLDLRWDVICPDCRIAKGTAASLSDLPTDVHCSSCNVDYRAHFAQSVELTFSASAALRSLDDARYCIGNPAATPHVLTQEVLRPGGSMRHLTGMDAGRLRVRALDTPGAAFVRASGSVTAAGPVTTVELADDGWPADELAVPPGAGLEIRNTSPDEHVVLVERVAFDDATLTAAEVLAHQRFRDLFAAEVLRPGERIEVGNVTILFTDLCGSTQLYRELGDATAFGRVRDHFAVLTRHVDDHGGAVVKTIGDAVMAVFPEPASAVRAVLAAQADLDAPLTLKAGLHHGPCLAVTLNDRLDYFGTTVNLAARLESRSGPDEVVVASQVAADPVLARLISVGTVTVSAEEHLELKGIEHPVDALRLAAPPS